MKSKPNKLYKESMKQKVGSLKRLTRPIYTSNMTKCRRNKAQINEIEMNNKT
jgi:hypothetical protein